MEIFQTSITEKLPGFDSLAAAIREDRPASFTRRRVQEVCSSRPGWSSLRRFHTISIGVIRVPVDFDVLRN